jgi:hypothetical protein
MFRRPLVNRIGPWDLRRSGDEDGNAGDFVEVTEALKQSDGFVSAEG